VVELRHYKRAVVDLPVEFGERGALERHPGRAKDLSVGGMYVQTEAPLPFGAQLVVYAVLPGQKEPLALPAIVRWSRPGDGMGLQFGLVGARETRAITELTKAP
jgi:hypothetical protein